MVTKLIGENHCADVPAPRAGADQPVHAMR